MTHPLLNHPIQNYLAESAFTLALDIAAERFELETDLDLSDLDESPVLFEIPSKALFCVKENDMSTNQVTLPAVLTEGPTGSLSSRVRCLAYEALDCPDLSQWKEKAEAHPAFDLIYQEIAHASNNGKLDAIMDELEAIGCVVTYDKMTSKLSLGLSLDKVCGGFAEHIALKDSRNKKVLDKVNGISPIKAFNDPEETVAAVTPLSPLHIVTFTLA